LPFRFNPLWLNSQDDVDRICQAWDTWIPDTPVYIWEKKLKLVKKSLKEWAKESFLSPSIEKEKLHSKLEELQLKMESEEITQQI
jgi:hypothetical protein